MVQLGSEISRLSAEDVELGEEGVDQFFGGRGGLNRVGVRRCGQRTGPPPIAGRIPPIQGGVVGEIATNREKGMRCSLRVRLPCDPSCGLEKRPPSIAGRIPPILCGLGRGPPTIAGRIPSRRGNLGNGVRVTGWVDVAITGVAGES